MDRAVYTYTKRELKKVAPVFGLGVLYVLFIFLSVLLVLRDEYLDKKAFEVVMREFEKDGSHSKLIWKLFIAEQWYQGCLR